MYLPRQRVFWAVGFGHLTNDIFMAMGAVVLAFLSASVLPMSNTQIGFAVSATQLMGAVSQPFFGGMADRTGGRWLGAGGLLWVVAMFLLAMLLAITTRNYWLMLIPFVLRGLGSGAVHPVGSLHAAEADKMRVATNMSYFFLLGQTGLALGPALAGVLLDWVNYDSALLYAEMVGMSSAFVNANNITPLFLLGLVALPTVGLMATSIPAGATFAGRASKRAQADAQTDADEKPKRAPATLNVPVLALSALAALVILRSLATPASVNFIPLLFQAKGWSPAEYGLIASFFWLASGISGVMMGNLADRIDRRLVVMGSLFLAAPAFFFLPLMDGVAAFALAIAAGGFAGGGHSIIVVLAQELMPASKGFASGAILGFIFGAGALGSLMIGALSDQIGLGVTFQVVAVAAVIAGGLALLLPRRRGV